MRCLKVFLIILATVQLCQYGLKAQEQAKKTSYRIPEEKHYKLLPLGASSFETVEKVCRSMMSEDGILTYEKNRNSILVYDTQKVIDKVDRFLRGIDREIVNIRINIDFVGSGSSQNDLIQVKTPFGEGRGKRPALIYRNGRLIKPKSTNVTLRQQRGTSTNNTSQFIVTKSGSPASIWKGKTVVDPSWLNNVILRPNVIIMSKDSTYVIPSEDPDIKWANVGASLQVLPYYYDDGTIDVEIYPSVSVIDGKGKRRAVKVTQMVSKVRVRSGQRIYIGGIISGKSEMYRNLFGPDFFSSKGGMNITDMYLTATAINPRGMPINAPAYSK